MTKYLKVKIGDLLFNVSVRPESNQLYFFSDSFTDDNAPKYDKDDALRTKDRV